jgi:hypothetical protein
MNRWRNLLKRGQPTGDADSRTLWLVYGLWLLAFVFKHGGAAWDIAWHFRYLRDDLAPPHLINTVGTALAFGLLALQSWTGLAAERTGLRLLQAGWLIFLISIPLDIINHRLFGLDLTTWSATHMLLYSGTTLMLVGVLRSWLKMAKPGPWATAYAICIWVLLLDDVLFPLGQQEYGVVAVADYLKGQPTASPDLLAFAGNDALRYAYGSLPTWLYPIWMVAVASLLLVIANRIQKWRWTATATTAIYLALRGLAGLALTSTGYSPSFIPVMILGAGVVIDLGLHYRWPAWLTTVLTAGVYYLGAMLISRWTLMPRFDWITAPGAAVLLWTGMTAWDWWRSETRQQRRFQWLPR